MTHDPEFEEWHLYALEEPYHGGHERKYENYWMARAFIAGKQAGRRAAIEECAKVADEGEFDCYEELCSVQHKVANAIRALAAEPPALPQSRPMEG